MYYIKNILLIGLFCVYSLAPGQTFINGIINDYTQVTGVNSSCSGCTLTQCATVTVASTSAFSAGDRVLLIQMKGAKADTSNTSSHGSILDIQDAGNYEFADIASISGSDITFEYPLSESYFTGVYPSDSACVQLIRVPVYSGDVTVDGLLEAQPWNGITGGVLALEVEGTLTLQANISVDGQGFKAAKEQAASISCTLDTNYYYQSTSWNYSCSGQNNPACVYMYTDSPTRIADQACSGGTCSTNAMTNSDNRLAGYRGESVVAHNFKLRFSNGDVAIFDKGKGKWGNGGGGGGTHNAGGGGGGNFGAGGQGGNVFNKFNGGTGCEPVMQSIQNGRGGVSLTPTSSRIYMGGGGGEGHYNTLAQGSTGTAGGGIIFITASSIVNGGSFSISANGLENTFDAINDGSGGGGAGGSILLDVSGGYTNAISISAVGGAGGDHYIDGANCHGTGGGGGGGLIWLSQGSPPANVTTNVSGGANGIQLDPNYDCGDINWGAEPGTNGSTQYGGSSPFFNTSPCGPVTLLPVELLNFSATPADGSVQLKWATETELNNDFFTVERSADGKHFRKVADIDANSSSHKKVNYGLLDENPHDGVNYYRLSQTDFEGKKEYLRMIQVTVEVPKPVWNLAPNPVTSSLNISINSPGAIEGFIQVVDVMGNHVLHSNANVEVGKSQINLDLSHLSGGCYVLRFISMHGRVLYTTKVFKVN